MTDSVFPTMPHRKSNLVFNFGVISPNMLGGLLIGVTISGVCLAIFKANVGGAWDNSKKQVMGEGHANWGAAYEEIHKATVTGDTFGDTYGPSLNILIKLISEVGMIIAPVLYRLHV